MNTAGVQLLAQADWPKLVALRLNGHGWEEVGVQELIKGSWPQLERLNLLGIRLSPKVVSASGCQSRKLAQATKTRYLRWQLQTVRC